jgi:hypothetical protein
MHLKYGCGFVDIGNKNLPKFEGCYEKTTLEEKHVFSIGLYD